MSDEPQTTPIIIMGGTDYTGIPAEEVVEHVRGMIHEQYGTPERQG